MMPMIQAINWSVCVDNPLQAKEFVSPMVSNPIYIVLILENLKSSGDTEMLINQDFNDELPTFLPLPETFDPMVAQDWEHLTQHIQEWLLDIPCDSQEWTWGCDAFWLAFVGAHSTFPMGIWPLWDTRIPMEGTYIEDLDQSSVSWTNRDETTLLQQTWLEFHSHVSLFYLFLMNKNCR